MGGDRVYLKGAASTAISEDKALIFGGYDIKGIPLNSLALLDWGTMRAENLQSVGKKPAPRAHHVAF